MTSVRIKIRKRGVFEHQEGVKSTSASYRTQSQERLVVSDRLSDVGKLCIDRCVSALSNIYDNALKYISQPLLRDINHFLSSGQEDVASIGYVSSGMPMIILCSLGMCFCMFSYSRCL